MNAAPTIRLTVAQAVVTYLSRQYSVADGVRRRLVPATLGIFGHGNVAGLGQALDQLAETMPFIQGRNEQALVHAATAFAKHNHRHATLAVTASIGPGAMNMVTGAALATVNRLPVLLLPGDTYATRHQGPVLQQLQHPTDADLTVNDAFRPVARFFDRITRPEQLLTALPAAMRTLVDPVETGAVVLSLPQDVQSHAYDFPAELFDERDWVIRRPAPDQSEIDAVAALLAAGREAADHRRRRGRLLAGHPRAGAARRRGRASRSRRPSPARARSSRPRGGSSAASAWKGLRRRTRWPGRRTWSSPSGPG